LKEVGAILEGRALFLCYGGGDVGTWGDEVMHSVLISDEAKALLDRLKAEGESETQFVEDAIRLRAAAASDDEAFVEAIEAGLDDMRHGRFTQVDSVEAHRVLWDGIAEEGRQRVARSR
jgi:predicted transcriptional regulator